jgi:hypothetical protein
VPLQNPPQRLKESLVKEALKTFAWDKFKQHLSMLDLDDEVVSELLSHIRRSTHFLIKRPDAAREAARSAFVDELGNFLKDQLGPDAVASLGDEVAVIERIEAGYHEILRTQAATVAAKLLPDTQASAALSRSAYAYHELMQAFLGASSRRKELTLQSFQIKQPDGSSYSPDGVFTPKASLAKP